MSYTLAAGVRVETSSTADPFATTAIALAGNELANAVYGNNGDNVLNGRGGNAALYGYDGADVFRFDSALGAGNVDGIGDYSVADDTIQLDDAVFAGLAAARSRPARSTPAPQRPRPTTGSSTTPPPAR